MDTNILYEYLTFRSLLQCRTESKHCFFLWKIQQRPLALRGSAPAVTILDEIEFILLRGTQDRGIRDEMSRERRHILDRGTCCTSCVRFSVYFLLLLLLLLLLKPTAQAKVGKIKLFINLFRDPTNNCATENWKKHNLWKQLKLACTLKPIQHSGANHSVKGMSFHTRSWAGRTHLAN